MADGSWVGVDLHARSAVASVLDRTSGELRTERVPAASEPLVAWLERLPEPVHVAYEAGRRSATTVRAVAIGVKTMPPPSVSTMSTSVQKHLGNTFV
jgi:hypothetical protein